MELEIFSKEPYFMRYLLTLAIASIEKVQSLNDKSMKKGADCDICHLSTQELKDEIENECLESLSTLVGSLLPHILLRCEKIDSWLDGARKIIREDWNDLENYIITRDRLNRIKKGLLKIRKVLIDF